MTLTADLGPGSRAKALDAMASGELDVLVVGAGVVGAGTALDAVSRGLSTALVEQRDFASGTCRAPRSWCTAACATWRCSTSGW